MTILTIGQRSPLLETLKFMDPLDKITLKSFLAALMRQNNSLPEDLQKQVNDIADNLPTTVSHLDFLTESYQPLEQEYMSARSALQNDGERFRSSAVLSETNDNVILSDEKLINFATEAFHAKDSVSFVKKAYAESNELRQLLLQLQPQKSFHYSLQEIAKLPVCERHKLIAPFILATADDFINNAELTEFSVLDVEDWERE